MSGTKSSGAYVPMRWQRRISPSAGETAFITVEGENHHILDYNKRVRWHDSIMAWFARWLQDDPTWWNTMYPEKNLK